MSIVQLNQIAKDFGVQGAAGLRKQELIFKILQAQAEKSGLIFSEGVLECLPDGFGFLRAPEYNYLPGPDDVYVSPSQIRRFDLRTGDTISGQIRPPKEGERYFALIKVDAINFEPPEEARNKIFFDNLTPLYPNERLRMETAKDNYSGRVMDLLTPIGKGQRGLIVCPAAHRQDHAAAEHRQLDHGQPSGSNPDRAADRRAPRRSHRHAALGQGRGDQLHLRRAGQPARPGGRNGDRKGQAAGGAQARRGDSAGFHHAAGAGLQHGRAAIGQGAVGRRGLQRPATAEAVFRRRQEHRGRRLADHRGHRPDRHRQPHGRRHLRGVQGHRQHGIHLDRKLVDKRIFPAIDINKSGTRKEELLQPREELARVWILRKVLSPLSQVECMELLLDKLGKTRSNAEFLGSMSG